MKSAEEFFKLPAAEEFFKKLQNELLQMQRPANEVILDDFDFCKFLKISSRHSANLRKRGKITYSKSGGKIYYRLSNILDFIIKDEIKCIDQNRNIFRPKNKRL
ncbi:MAG: helix-turn-helix domain-containing protein [bacterium]